MIAANEYCESVFDGTHATPKPAKKGYKLLTSKNILNGSLNTEDAYYISEKDYAEINRRSQVHQWDILFSMIGTVGNVCLVTDSHINFAIKNMGVFSCRDEKKAKWLYYYLQSPYAKSIINHYMNGAVQKFLPLDFLRNFPVPEYKKNSERITNILWSIDTKIRTNDEASNTLESLAKTIYDYWFLQFDFPDENGRPYKSSGGKMVWNEELKREIPEGWKVGTLYDLANFVNGIACQKYRPLDDEHRLPVIKIKEMHDGYTAETEYVRSDLKPENIIHNGDIIFSWSATLEVMIWNGGTGGLNQHIFKVIPHEGYSKHYVYQQLSAYIVNFQLMAEARKTTMGHITTDHLNQSRVVLPPRSVMDGYEEAVEKMYAETTTLDSQNRQLSSLRDFLLPMLMNGQVTFEDNI